MHNAQMHTFTFGQPIAFSAALPRTLRHMGGEIYLFECTQPYKRLELSECTLDFPNTSRGYRAPYTEVLVSSALHTDRICKIREQIEQVYQQQLAPRMQRNINHYVAKDYNLSDELPAFIGYDDYGEQQRFDSGVLPLELTTEGEAFEGDVHALEEVFNMSALEEKQLDVTLALVGLLYDNLHDYWLEYFRVVEADIN